MKTLRPNIATCLCLWWSVYAFALAPVTLMAAPANPKDFDVSQPDGTKITIRLRGDEFYSWFEDSNGYTVVKDTTTNEWLYLEKGTKGELKPTRYKVGAYDPSKLNLKKYITDSLKARTAKYTRNTVSPPSYSVSSALSQGGVAMSPPLTGTLKNLVIMARFSDQAATYSQAQFDNLFNQVGYNFDGALGSVKDYYKEVSYNKLSIQSTVSQWVTLPNGYAYYGANDPDDPYNPKGVNARQMVIDAINALDAAGFDFSTVDGNNDGEVDLLTIIHSGRGEESGTNNPNYIWAHKGALASPIYKDGKMMQAYHTEAEVRGNDGDPLGIIRIGVIAHEIGHFLGLPDFYDYGYDSKGIGKFCLMAGGAWNGPNDEGESPSHMSAVCKMALGWASVTQISNAGSYSLPQIETNDTAIYKFKADAFLSSEFFLMENRQMAGFDWYIPGNTNGILIWHIDGSMPDNDDQTHYMVDLEEASAIQHLENNVDGDDLDYFRLGNNTAFGDGTSPNSKSYLGYNLGFHINNISASGDPMTFDVTKTAASKLSMGKLKAYPSPCYFDKNPEITIMGIPPDATEVKVYIYSAAGKLVRTLESGSEINEDSIAVWDGRDESGVKSASGIYIYLAKSANYEGATGKFYVFW